MTIRTITSKTPRCAGTLLATALAFLALAGTGAQAQTYTKVGTALDNLPATAQFTTGVGSLTTILGSLTTTSATSTASNPDLFAIYIDGSSLFSATTFGVNTTLFDTPLFLFNSTGAGVYANDDISDFSKRSAINAPVALTPGLYFLGISAYGAIPRSGTGAAFDIFANPVDDITITDFTALRTPKPGITGPLTNWNLSTADVETGVYSIGLTGASFASAAVPEASTIVSFGLLLALGLGGLVLASKRKKTSVKSASAV